MARRRWLDKDEQTAWRAYLLTTQLVDEALDRQLQRDAQMPHAYYGILVRLDEARQRPGEGTLRMTDLARGLRYSQSRLTHAITSMEGSGWVERRDCPTDRRSQLVAITEQGVAALADAAPGHVAAVRSAVFDQLTAEQVTQLGEICTAIVRGFEPPVTPPG
ncbi:MAG: MarR family transcriptional regulator [Ilumatobacteraceae bacterium]|nr:MarR family transcriptional regulator [Ilumatobacteraceae bacterium]MCU1397489.1 MarR family transcriptional regulator [Acidimicrobiales bacterium]